MVLMQYSREHPDAQMAAQILALEETAWPSDGENAPFPSAPETYVLLLSCSMRAEPFAMWESETVPFPIKDRPILPMD